MIFWDSSALVALLVDETETEERRRQLQADPDLAVWWARPSSVKSAIQRRLREGSLGIEQGRLARERLKELSFAWQEVAPVEAVRTLARRLVRTHPLRAGDALQLAAALALHQAGLPRLAFASANTRLSAAAEAEGLKII